MRSLATVSDAGPAPTSATRLPFFSRGTGGKYSVTSSRKAAAARWLTGPIAGAAQDSRKDVRLPIEEIRLRVPALGDEANVFRHVRVRRTRPLAVDDLMVVLRIADVGGHSLAAPRAGSGLDDRSRTKQSQSAPLFNSTSHIVGL